MPRRKFKNKNERKRYVAHWTPTEYASDWCVIMTDGSNVHRVNVSGTRVSAWNKAIRVGLDEHDEIMPGVWWPLDISAVGEFAAV